MSLLLFHTHTHILTYLLGTISSSEAGRSRTSRAPKVGYQPGFLFKHYHQPILPHSHQSEGLSLILKLTSLFPSKTEAIRCEHLQTLGPHLRPPQTSPPLSYLCPTLTIPFSLLHQDLAPSPVFSFAPNLSFHNIFCVKPTNLLCFHTPNRLLLQPHSGWLTSPKDRVHFPSFLLPQHTVPGPTPSPL